MSPKSRKILIAVFLVSVIVLAGILMISIPREEEAREREAPSMEWVNRLNGAVSARTGVLDGKVMILDSVRDNAFQVSPAASAASVRRAGGEMIYDPLVMLDETGDSLERYLSLTQNEPYEIDPTDPERATMDIAMDCFGSSDFIIVYDTYRGGLKAAALASYYDIPMVYSRENSPELSTTIEELGVRYAISMDDGPILDVPTMALGGTEPCHNGFLMWCLESNDDVSDYMIVTNPDDIDNDWGERGHIPIRGLSAASAQLAAYRTAMVFFVKGYREKEIGVDFDDIENYNQMGASIDVANNYSDRIKEKVLHAQEEANVTGSFELKHLGIVGDPIAIPYHYEDYGDGGDGPFFSNTNFIASDYYFADIMEDRHQDISYGRIMGRSLTDTFLLNARTLGFGEYSECEFERGNDIDQRVYDTISPDWRDNAGVFVGTTKPFPMPGALKHMKKYQYDVLGYGGMFVTTEESMLLNDITADMVMDKMNCPTLEVTESKIEMYYFLYF